MRFEEFCLELQKKYVDYSHENNKGAILFEASNEHNPKGNLTSIIFLNAMSALGYRPDFLVSSKNVPGYKLFQYFGSKFHIYGSLLVLIMYVPLILLKLVKCMPKTFSFHSLFELQISGVYMGDAIYDDYLRSSGKGTYRGLDILYVKKIIEAVFFVHYFNALLKNNRFSYVVINHQAYIRQLALLRVSRKLGVPVIFKMGQSPKKIFNDELVFQNPFQPNSTIINNLISDEELLLLAKKIFSDSMPEYQRYRSIQVEQLNDNGIDDKLGRLSKEKGEKKLIVIAAHVFTDSVCGSYGKRNFYYDYCLWIKNTLKVLFENKNIIVKIKTHPLEHIYSNVLKASDYLKELGYDDNLLWDNSISLKDAVHLIDVVITSKGSVGFEMPSYGIPVLCSGKGHAAYSSFGVVIEPEDVQHYESILQDIHLLKKLSERDVFKSKLFMFIYNKQHYILKPETDLSREELFKPEYVRNPVLIQEGKVKNPYRDNIYKIILEKLERFHETDEKDYLDDMNHFLNSHETVYFRESRLTKTYIKKELERSNEK